MFYVSTIQYGHRNGSRDAGYMRERLCTIQRNEEDNYGKEINHG